VIFNANKKVYPGQTLSMKKITAIAIFLTLINAACYLETNNKESRFEKRGTLLIPQKKPEKPPISLSALSNTTDIHYSAQYCTECHVNIPRKGSNPQLRYAGDFKALCRCHYSTSNNYIHPVDRKPSREMMAAIPDQFPLREGQIACSTCHDIVIQCHDRPLERAFLKDDKFLRGAPFETKTDICFRCHKIESYRMFNPHRQLNAQKEIIQEKCLYCHTQLPDVNQTRTENARLIGDFETLCIRCHMKTPRQDFHAKHLRKPTDDVLLRIKQMEDQHGIILPLNGEGMITCATCHNPHEKGVIPDIRAGAKGAGERFRHRLTNHDSMCIKCHAMR
jgi:hypothetical protein